METARIGGTAKGGICRLTLTDLDRQVRDWFRAQAEALGCTVTVDEVGNMFALKPGRRGDVAPIALGSHLDTQPTGGKFDGVLGVLGGLEVAAHPARSRLRDQRAADARQLDERGGLALRARHARLGRLCRRLRPRFRGRLRRPGGRHLRRGPRRDRLPRRGAGRARCRSGRCSNCTSSRGRSWRRRRKTIGVVQGVQGMRWYEVELDRPRGPHRLDADEPAQQRAPRRGAPDRAGRRHRPRACAGRRRHGRARRGQAELAQRHPGPRLLLRRFPASGGRRARRDGAGARGGGAGGAPADSASTADAAQGLGLAGRPLRCRLHRGGARRRGEGRPARPATWSRAPATTPPTSPGSRRRR